MFTAIRGFVGRHRKKVFFGTLFAISAVYFYRKIYPWIRQARDLMKMMRQLQGPELTTEQKAQKAREDRRKFAERASLGSEKEVSTDIANLHPHIRRSVGLADVEPFREKEAAARAESKEAQKSIWNLLKIVAVTYAVAGMYIVAMHDLLKRMQIALIAHHTIQEIPIPVAAQRSFLKLTYVPPSESEQGGERASEEGSSCSHLVSAGLEQLVQEVRQAAQHVVGPSKLGQTLASDGVRQMLLDMRRQLEGDGTSHVRMIQRFLLPPEPASEAPTALVVPGDSEITAEGLLDELRDVIDGPDFACVLRERLDVGFQHLERKIVSKAFEPQKTSKEEQGGSTGKPLARLLGPIKDAAVDIFKKEEGWRRQVLRDMDELETSKDFFSLFFGNSGHDSGAASS